MVYVKLTTENNIHNGYQYKEGLNCLNGKFNNEKICDSGGLYFCRKEDVGKWVEYNNKLMHYIWDVELCEDSKIVDMGDKLKTDKFILKNKRTIWDNEEICKLAVHNEPFTLKYVKNQTYEICKLAFQKDGNTLYYVKKQTYEICKLACIQDGYALYYVKPEFMTEEICKLAVQQNGYVLCYVPPKFMTEEICKLAVKQNGDALQYIKPEFMNDEICKLATGYTLNELKFRKFDILTKLEKLRSEGINIYGYFNMNSDLKEMEKYLKEIENNTKEMENDTEPDVEV